MKGKGYLLSLPFGLFLLMHSISVSAKSVWLECGEYQFNLDENRREYTTKIQLGRLPTKLVQGTATFFPSHINFSVPTLIFPDGGGIQNDFSINRKTLEYQQPTMSRDISYITGDTGWVLQKRSNNPKIGICRVIKNQAEGNKI